MTRLKRLPLREVLRILAEFGSEIVSMRGSHAKLVRLAVSGERQVLTVPVRSQLQIGTVLAIYRSVPRLLPSEELRSKFVSD